MSILKNTKENALLTISNVSYTDVGGPGCENKRSSAAVLQYFLNVVRVHFIIEVATCGWYWAKK